MTMSSARTRGDGDAELAGGTCGTIALALGACASTPRVACAAGEQAMVAETLFFGTNIPGGGVVTDAEWTAFVSEVVTPRFPDGLTTWSASGQWRGASGTVEREGAHVLTLLRTADAAPRHGGRRDRTGIQGPASARKPCCASTARPASRSDRSPAMNPRSLLHVLSVLLLLPYLVLAIMFVLLGPADRQRWLWAMLDALLTQFIWIVPWGLLGFVVGVLVLIGLGFGARTLWFAALATGLLATASLMVLLLYPATRWTGANCCSCCPCVVALAARVLDLPRRARSDPGRRRGPSSPAPP
jgi:hypothetical protein